VLRKEHEMVWACSTYGRRGIYTVFFLGKHEEQRKPGRPCRRWEDNIKWILEKLVVGYELNLYGLK
jgi:hypothetical protein